MNRTMNMAKTTYIMRCKVAAIFILVSLSILFLFWLRCDTKVAGWGVQLVTKPPFIFVSFYDFVLFNYINV